MLGRLQIVLAVATAALLCGVGVWWVQIARVSGGSATSGAMPVVAIAPGAAATPEPTPGVTAVRALMPAGLVSAGWLSQTAVATGIPVRALQAYAGAAIVETARHAGCHLGWNTLAAIGEEESAHGTFHGDAIQPDGRERTPIIGPALDGTGGTAAIADSDHGALDGDAAGDRAVGPMQILPSTWATYGIDADGDGTADPQQIDDAALAAGEYLCAAGGDLSKAAGWTAAIHAYNADDAYVAAVRTDADRYATEAAGA